MKSACAIAVVMAWLVALAPDAPPQSACVEGSFGFARFGTAKFGSADQICGVPTLTSLNPRGAKPGTAVTVAAMGTNFVAGSTSVAVDQSGIIVGSVMVVSPTSLTAVFTVDENATRTDHGVTITTSNGATASRSFRVSIFTDDPLAAGASTIRAVHITELRAEVNAARQAHGLPPFSFTDASLGGARVLAQHINELRAALAAAYTAAGVAHPTYTDPGLAAGMSVKLAHIDELRTAVIGIR